MTTLEAATRLGGALARFACANMLSVPGARAILFAATPDAYSAERVAALEAFNVGMDGSGS